jgi:hypothetical protein
MIPPRTPTVDALLTVGGFVLLASAGAMLAQFGLAVLTSWPLFYLAAGAVVVGLILRARYELQQGVIPAPLRPKIVKTTFC